MGSNGSGDVVARCGRSGVALALGALVPVGTFPQMGSAPPAARSHTAAPRAVRLERELVRVVDARKAAAKGKKRWLSGPPSYTLERDPFGNIVRSTMEVVAYKGKRNATFPRVGNIYHVSIWVGRIGDDSAGKGVVTEVDLPYRTRLAIRNSVKKRRVRCYKGRANGRYREVKGRKCPNRPIRGVHGWRFVPRRGSWKVPRKRWIEVVFPVRSRRPLRGIADRRNACIVGSVHNLSGWATRDWDAPRRGERCPLREGHGAYQGVFVAPRR
jgi:hypothetical protein